MLMSQQFRSKYDHFSALRDARLGFLDMSLDEQLTVMKRLGGSPVRHGGVEAVTFLRPGAKDFLVECMGIARTCILTQGMHTFQERVVEALDLPVKDLYGNLDEEDVDYGSSVPKTPAAILVDDMPQESELVQRKLKAIGLTGETDRFIEVKGWEGFGGDKTDYDAVLKKIRTLVKQ